MAEIYLVRHGQASFGAADYDQLSALGENQSRLLGDWLQSCNQRPDRVLHGRLRRQRQTAAACLDWLAPAGLAPAAAWCEWAEFDEFDHQEVLTVYQPQFASPAAVRHFLAHSPEPRQAFQRHFEAAMQRWLSGVYDADYSESWPAFRARCERGLQRLQQDCAAARSQWVFTSGGCIAAVLQSLLGLSNAGVIALNNQLVNSGVTRLLAQPGRISVSYINSFSHLEAAGQADWVTYR